MSPSKESTHDAPPVTAGPTRFTYKSADGLTLSGEKWEATGCSEAPKVPVLCLPGLSRNTKDFHAIARFLQEQGHEVIALDYRGRGQSEWDPEWHNYALPIEGQDIDAALSFLAIERFAILGTSRGGLHAMAMAERMDAGRIAGIILNDIGPRIEMKGIHRLAASIGKQMKFLDQASCAGALMAGLNTQFPAMSAEDWLRFAGQLGASTHDGFILEYDPALAKTLAMMDDGTPLPDIWPLFGTTTNMPMLILRGQHSDILSDDTCGEMKSRHPSAIVHEVSGEGHAPMLWDATTQERIAAFLAQLNA